MASQDNNNNKSMCTVTGYDDYYDDDLGALLDYPWDPLESGDVDDLPEGWGSNLGGPIPSGVFPEVLPPVSFADILTESGGSNVGTCEAEFKPIVHNVVKPQQKPQHPPAFSQEKKPYRVPKFEAPSPDSVLESRTSSSAGKTISFGTKIDIPVRTRTKRSRPQSGLGLTSTSWSKSLQQFPIQRVKKKRTLAQNNDANEVKKCSHCEITKTPQWREGPMGPKTLCNACGVRYRSGRLFPEYRPAASPTFVPSLHSNSHRKVVEMRQKGAGMNNNYVVKKPFVHE